MKERKVKKEWNLRQIGNMALIVGVFAIFLVGICFVRFSKASVNAFIGNYTGIEEMLATMKGGANTDAAKRELLNVFLTIPQDRMMPGKNSTREKGLRCRRKIISG